MTYHYLTVIKEAYISNSLLTLIKKINQNQNKIQQAGPAIQTGLDLHPYQAYA